MKKFIYSSIAVLATLFAVSCEQDNIEAMLQMSDAKEQILGAFENATLTADGDKLTATFDPAKYNITVPVGYTLLMDVNGGDFSEAVKPAATITVDKESNKGTISISQKDLNSAILNMGAEADAEFTVQFKLLAYALNDKTANIESTKLESNVVTATFVPYSANLLDVDVYEHLWVIGSGAKVGSWAHGSVYQFLYNYTKDGATFTGLIDYGENAADGWKLTDQADWDGGNYGSEAQAEEAEAASFNLIDGGGSKDIKNYSKRFYMWEFNKTSLLLTKKYGFNNIGIVGSFNGWNAADENLKMAYNDSYHRFYIDYTFSEDAELKFTCDDDWSLNFGVDCVQGGDNIAVSAGSYRIYLDLNKDEYTFNASMYGKDEPTNEIGGDKPDEPTTYQGWGIIGVGGDWETDLAMSENSGVWTGYAQISKDDSFKLRKDAAWTENFGGEGDGTYVVTLGQAFTGVAGGANLAVPADGFYKIVFDSASSQITISEGEVWSLIGAFNSWSGDVDMVLTDGKWVSPATTISGEFKIRHNHAWDDNRGGTMEELGTAFAVTNGGDNINVEEGDYIVTYDPEAETITVEGAVPANLWSLIGGIEGSSWNKDFYMTETMPGLWVSEPVKLDGEFKIRYNNDWGVNRGGACAANDDTFAVTQDGSNIVPPTAGDTYIVTYYAAADAISIHDMTKGWSLIGSINGSSWDLDIPMVEVAEGVYSGTCLVNSEVKIRKGMGWDDNRGGSFSELGTAFDVTNGGDNIKLDEGNYTITYDSKNEKITVVKAWSLIGGIFTTSWDSDLFMICDAEGNYVCQNASLTGEWKIRENAGWDNNRGGAFSALGTAFAVTNGGDNIATPGEGLYKVVYNPSKEEVTVTKSFPKSE